MFRVTVVAVAVVAVVAVVVVVQVSLLSGPTLARAQRDTAERFWLHRARPNFQVVANSRWGPLVVVGARAEQDVTVATTLAIVQLLQVSGEKLAAELRAHGVLVEGRALDVAELDTRRWCILFRDHVVVFLKSPHLGRLCSCGAFGIAAQCEHTVFTEALTLPAFPPTRSLETLPARRRCGRPKGISRPPKQPRRS